MTRVRVVAAAAVLLALAGCGFGNPWPAVPPDVPAPIDVTLFGDSVMNGTGPFLHDGLTWYGQPSTVVDRSIIGSGLLDPGNHAYVESNLPASGVVVFEYVGMCWGCPIPYGTFPFYVEWRAEMHTLITDARNKGLRVVWVKPPPVANPFIAPVTAALAPIVDEVTAQDGVVECDWWQALGDTNGSYQDWLWYQAVWQPPEAHLVRAGDGLHLSDDGRRRSAAWTAAAIMTAAA
jgi:hypothetical protein